MFCSTDNELIGAQGKTKDFVAQTRDNGNKGDCQVIGYTMRCCIKNIKVENHKIVIGGYSRRILANTKRMIVLIFKAQVILDKTIKNN